MPLSFMMPFALATLSTQQNDLQKVPLKEPIGIFLNCQSQARVKNCKYLKSQIEASNLMALAPRATADLTIVINAVQQANTDDVFLRFISTEKEAYQPVELQFQIDSRLPVDQQRVALFKGFHKGLAPYLIHTHPEALSVQLIEPKGTKKKQGSPWGWSISAGGWGNWMEDYKSGSLNTSWQIQRIDAITKLLLRITGNGWLERQPPLIIDNEEISLDSDTYSGAITSYYSKNLSQEWTVGGTIRTGMSDPENQFKWTGKTHVGIERNWFPLNDPRGNKLSASYMIGAQWDVYNQTNQLGENTAIFPSHIAVLNGSIRKDTYEVGIDLGARMELLQPTRRNVFNARAWTDFFWGDHVDIRFSLGVTKQAIPGPAEVDSTDFESVKQANYAEPLRFNGDFNIRLHWDATNGIRNNRFRSSAWLGELNNL